MRKYQHKQVLKLLKTIKQALTAKLYGDCQEGALSLCDFIEALEGNEEAGAETVTLLVEFCELLFKANNGEIGEKVLHKHLIKIENNINYKLKSNKIEIIFLSYKASMSDSIETIYLATKNDPNCDAYWIPIPYYSRNSDGSFGEMHYEDSVYYGKNIECTDFREYDIKERHPDVVFTFNPYDIQKTAFPDSFFMFNKAEHPNVEVIDLTF